MNHFKGTDKKYHLITCKTCGREIMSRLVDECRDCYEARFYNRKSLFQKLQSRNYVEDDHGIITDTNGNKHVVTLEEFEKCKDILWSTTGGKYAHNSKIGLLTTFLKRPKKIRKDCTKIKPDPRPNREWTYAYKIVDGLKVNNMIIYKATSPSGKVYIGKTVQRLCERKGGHKHAANRSNKGGKFITAIRKYGIDSFQWEVLETTSDYDTLNALECWYIQHYDSINSGYNTCIGGDIGTTGIPCKEETKLKLSAMNKGKYNGHKRTHKEYCDFHDRKNWPWIAGYDQEDKLMYLERNAKDMGLHFGVKPSTIYGYIKEGIRNKEGILFKKVYKNELNIAS